MSVIDNFDKIEFTKSFPDLSDEYFNYWSSFQHIIKLKDDYNKNIKLNKDLTYILCGCKDDKIAIYTKGYMYTKKWYKKSNFSYLKKINIYSYNGRIEDKPYYLSERTVKDISKYRNIENE